MFRKKKYTNLPNQAEVQMLMIELAYQQASTLNRKNPNGLNLIRRAFKEPNTIGALLEFTQTTLHRVFWDVK